MVQEQVSIRLLGDFIVNIVRHSIECGCSSNRVEALANRISEVWGYTVDVAALPTVVWISLKGKGNHLVELVRVRNWSIDLAKLTYVNDLVDEIEHDKILLEEAVEKLSKIDLQVSPYPKWFGYLAGGGSSLALIHQFQGNVYEIVFGFCLGLICQAVIRMFKSGNRRFISDFVAAFVIASIAHILARFFSELSLARLILGGLISLFPGLTLVNGLHEVAQKNLVSGAARLLEALMIGISLAFGVASSIGLALYLDQFLPFWKV